jgi:hypothetical protein
MRQPAQQIQLALNPSQNPIMRRQKPYIPQSPQIPNRSSTQVSKKAGMWHQERNHHDKNERCRPGRYPHVPDLEVRVDAVLFDCLVGEEEEDPDAGADGGAVGVEDEDFEEGVEGAWQPAEGAGEEDGGYYCAVFGFEAFEEGQECEGVEEEVEDVAVQEGVCV